MSLNSARLVRFIHGAGEGAPLGNFLPENLPLAASTSNRDIVSRLPALGSVIPTQVEDLGSRPISRTLNEFLLFRKPFSTRRTEQRMEARLRVRRDVA